jgi:hypothetical protein
MYFTLLASIGTESKTILSQHAFYHANSEQNSDSDVLAIIISKTHYTVVSGDNPLRKYNMRAKKEMEFGLFRMKADMTLGELYERFVEYRRILADRSEGRSPKSEVRGTELPIKARRKTCRDDQIWITALSLERRIQRP